jgi:superfamily II DNA or RNA helicase
MESIILRDYQTRSIDKIKKAYQQGYRKVILRLDCGAGKTITAAKMCIDATKKGNKVLFLVHRKELLDQTYEAFKFINADMTNIDIGMIITVGKNLDKYNPNFIIADECNFSLSKTWRKVLDYYSQAWILGLSATPSRLDGRPMGDIFDLIIEDVSADELIAMGKLAPYDYYAPKLNIDLSNVGIRAGDYKQEEIERIMDKPKIYGDVISYYKNGNHKKAIAYCTSINHSMTVAEEFRNHGFKAEHIDGNTSKSERDRIIDEFKNGDIEILCNCDLISFGFDVPDCDTIMLLRPTTSVALYIQQSMRAMRPREGKRAVVYDFVGNVFRHGMPTEKRDWSLTGRIKARNADGEPDVLVRQCEACYRVYGGIGCVCPYCGHDNGKTRAEIKRDEEAQLELVRKVERQQQGRAQTYDELVKIGYERGYKNPQYWARMVVTSRGKKGDNI